MTTEARAPSNVLITGASSGIGAELARVFAREGHNLVLVARSRNRLDDIAREFREAHAATVRVFPSDLSVPGAASALHERVAGEGIAVDIVVNDAGFGMRARFVELDPARQLEMIQVNIVALTEITRLFLAGDGAARGRPHPERGVDRGIPARASHGRVLRDEGVRTPRLARGLRLPCRGGGTVSSRFQFASFPSRLRPVSRDRSSRMREVAADEPIPFPHHASSGSTQWSAKPSRSIRS